MSYLTPALEQRRRGPHARLPMADALRTPGEYNISEAAFEPVPDGHPLLHRHRTVERFRSSRRWPLRPRFNKSTKDELHPFPERALTNTNACYNGVDVAVTHFPAVVKNSAFLRLPTVRTRGLWTGNVSKAKHSHRYNFQCPGLDEKEPPLSYLAEKIVEDCSEDRLLKQRGWCGDREQKSIFAAVPKEPDYVEMNQRISAQRLGKTYSGPLEKAKRVNEERQAMKRLMREAEAEQPMTFHYRPDAPKVFKMSNIDEWWNLNSVEVCREQVSGKAQLESNPYRKDCFV